MGKKPQAMNKKMIAIGGGAIIVLGLLLVGTYGNSLKTQIGIFPGQDRPLNTGESQHCIDAKQYLKETKDIFHLRCRSFILTVPHVPSSQCITAGFNVEDAERNVESACGPDFPRPGDDEDGVFEPPVAPPVIYPLFATVTPTPATTTPASARPGV